MSKATLIVILFLMAISSSAQDGSIQIKGKIVDAETNEGLSFSSVKLKNSFKGTIANDVGEFVLHIDPSDLKDTLVISMMGYLNSSTPLSQRNDNRTYKLKHSAITLNEVVVNAGLSADEIVKLAVEKIKVNYPVKPYLMKAFYKKTLRENGKYISLVEGAGRVLDTKGFLLSKNSRQGGEQIVLEQARGNFALTDKGPNFIYVNYFLAHFSKNMVKHLNEFFTQGKFQREDDIFLDTARIYVVAAEGPRYGFKAWIDAQSYAIIKCVVASKQLPENVYLDRGPFDTTSFFAAKRQVIYNEFQNYDGKYYPKYIKVEVDWQVYDKRTEQPIKGMLTTRTSEIMINDVQTTNLPDFKKEKLLDPSGEIEYQWKLMGKSYDAAFWANYNSIARNPLENELIRDLEKLGPLEEQFSKPIPSNVQIRLFKNDQKYLESVLKQARKNQKKSN